MKKVRGISLENMMKTQDSLSFTKEVDFWSIDHYFFLFIIFFMIKHLSGFFKDLKSKSNSVI